MTNQRFIDMIRQYASLARRTRKSYAPVVNELVRLRKEAIDDEIADLEKRGLAQRTIEAIAVREYGKFDEKFTLSEPD